MATPSVCFHHISLNIKYESLVAKDRRSLNLPFLKTMSTVAVFNKIVCANSDVFLIGNATKK